MQKNTLQLRTFKISENKMLLIFFFFNWSFFSFPPSLRLTSLGEDSVVAYIPNENRVKIHNKIRKVVHWELCFPLREYWETTERLLTQCIRYLIDLNGRLSLIDWKPLLQQRDFLKNPSMMLCLISYLESGITNFIYFLILFTHNLKIKLLKSTKLDFFWWQ